MRLSITILLMFFCFIFDAKGHEIYTGVQDKFGHACCGGNDCFQTVYKYDDKHGYAIKDKEGEWIRIDVSYITFRPVAGEDDTKDHAAHLCYRQPFDTDFSNADFVKRIFYTEDGRPWFIYCAFISPGGT